MTNDERKVMIDSIIDMTNRNHGILVFDEKHDFFDRNNDMICFTDTATHNGTISHYYDGGVIRMDDLNDESLLLLKQLCEKAIKQHENYMRMLHAIKVDDVADLVTDFI